LTGKRIKASFSGENVSTNGGAFLLCEVAEGLGIFGEWLRPSQISGIPPTSLEAMQSHKQLCKTLPEPHLELIPLLR